MPNREIMKTPSATPDSTSTPASVPKPHHLRFHLPHVIELKKRKQAWKKPALRYTRGGLAKYAAYVTSDSFGTVTDTDLKL